MRYQVKAGDSLSSIAKSHYGDSTKAGWIASENQLANPNQIYPGQQLELPDLPTDTKAALVSPALLSALCPRLSSDALASYCSALALKNNRYKVWCSFCFLTVVLHYSCNSVRHRKHALGFRRTLTPLDKKAHRFGWARGGNAF